MKRAEWAKLKREEQERVDRELTVEAQLVGEMPEARFEEPSYQQNVLEATGFASSPGTAAVKGSIISPRLEQAIRLYATGQLATQSDAARSCGLDEAAFSQAWNSPAGQKVADCVRVGLEKKFQDLFGKVITVIDDSLQHPEPSVALAGANLWLRTNKGSKIEVALTAEDVIQKLISGDEPSV